MRRVVNRKPRILIVDDDPLMCDIIAATLEDAYELAIVTDGLDVRERMWAVDPDLVILDCNLPGRPGMMVLEDIRTSASNAAIPVMMLTGRQGNWTQSAAARNGASHFMRKPFAAAELRDAVTQLLAGITTAV
jgi:DNA-binding response OmpR family regulator